MGDRMTDLVDQAEAIERKPMTTAEIKAVMLTRYAAPEWALLFEVGNGTGMHQRTWADAVAMSLWPSRGLEVFGFEFKASRSDWKRELALPKAEPVARYCDRWFVVAADGVIRDVNEVPAGWGYIKAAGGILRVVKEAPPREGVEISRSFLAACLRRASQADHELLTAAVSKARSDGEKAGEQRERARKFAERYGERDENLRKAVRQFELATGLQISEYNGPRLVEDVRAVQLLNGTHWDSLHQAIEKAEKFAEAAKAIQRKVKP